MNDYFSFTPLVDGALAKASLWNTPYTDLVGAFDKLPAEKDLKLGTVQLGVDSGAANAYAITLPYTALSYTDGMQVIFKALNTNTGASTIDVDSVGVKSLLSQSGMALSSGDIPSGKFIACAYNASADAFEILGTVGDAAIRAAISTVAGLVAQSGVKASLTDTTVGTLQDKTVAGPGISITLNNPGGNETLTFAFDEFNLKKYGVI